MSGRGIDLLVVGYGNTLRRDDGVGPHIADTVASWNIPGLEALAMHQLTPELAPRFAAVARVIFVDAALHTPQVELRPVSPGPATQALGHACSPSWLLGLTQALYGSCPEAWLLTVPVVDLGFGEELSLPARDAMQSALACLRDFVEDGGG